MLVVLWFRNDFWSEINWNWLNNLRLLLIFRGLLTGFVQFSLNVSPTWPWNCVVLCSLVIDVWMRKWFCGFSHSCLFSAVTCDSLDRVLLREKSIRINFWTSIYLLLMQQVFEAIFRIDKQNYIQKHLKIQKQYHLLIKNNSHM